MIVRVWHVPGQPQVDFHSTGGHVLYMDWHVADVPQVELSTSPSDSGFSVLKQMLAVLRDRS
jgi:prepilin-type processing-associated H-X9-DG protein